MRISKHEEYGLRLVTQLAGRQDQVAIREMAAFEGLPETTVAKVVARLRKAGLVSSERGRNGGYTLTLPPDEITLAQVVEAFGSGVYDGDFCARMSSGGDCAHDEKCGLRPVWHGLGAVIGNFLAGVTVADLVQGDAAAIRRARNMDHLPVLG